MNVVKLLLLEKIKPKHVIRRHRLMCQGRVVLPMQGAI